MRKQDDEETEEETQMESQRRLAKERRLREEAAAAALKAAPTPSVPVVRRGEPPPTPYERDHPHLIAQRPTKPRKPPTSKVAKYMREHENDWRVCEAPINHAGMKCLKQVLDNPVSTMCKKHRDRRARFGDPRRSSHVAPRLYRGYIRRARKLLRKTPPDQPVCDAVAALLIPPQAGIPGRRDGYKRRQWLIREIVRWSDPRYRKKYPKHAASKAQPFKYTTRDLLSVLVGVTVYLEQHRDSWPGESDRIETAYAFIRLWKRPRGPKGNKGNKKSASIFGSVLRGVAKRILNPDSCLGSYLLLTAQAIIKDLDREQEAINQRFHDAAIRKQQAAAKAIEDARVARKLAFDNMEEPEYPGEMVHFTDYELQDVRIRAAIERWRVATKKYHDYHRMRQEIYPDE